MKTNDRCDNFRASCQEIEGNLKEDRDLGIGNLEKGNCDYWGKFKKKAG